ncbi:mechanosensitive ion channel family protein [Formosa algae]|uniref:Small-conductance mechanosensitive channel n=1 Tax=Formosa algae TaxID=225843 RepID=A0A9X0YI21_9FLAO|nr:mechanosensitive ion channel domain-containing protein [Formosa algae]MBP1838138.1 small-conductance mechanosensitive channel [Formosa algae]MDQ0334273.1 small-conductance mechanosensitive channel [Formosa algae]
MKKYTNLIIAGLLLVLVICLNPLTRLLTRLTTLDFTVLISQKQNFMIAISAWISIEVLHKLKTRFLKHYDISQEDNLHSRKIYTQFNILEKVMIFVIIIMATGLILLSFDGIRKFGVGLFASAGVAGIILGLSAQKVVGALLAGIQIAITQPFRIDDAVVVEGEWGWIEEINLTYVVVRVWDKRRLVLPSSYFLEKPFQNWTRNNADIMGTIFLYTDYNIPFDDLRTELTRLLEGSDLWDGKVNVLQVTESKETTVESRILVSARNSPIAWDLRVYIREKMIEYIQKNYPDSLPRTRVVIEGRNLKPQQH